MKVNLTYSDVQSAAFFESPQNSKFNIFPKGRRVGFTRGGLQAAIEWALDGEAVLWGDTINDNIRKYIERYAVPVMEKEGIPYDWNKNAKVIKFPNGGFIDFRSSDKPENWEGFGYHRILLNEAGIILEGDRGRYLYQNSVLPMLMDFPQSKLYAFGVPKGTLSLYYDLWCRVEAGTEGYYGKTFSSYDTPFLSLESVDLLKQEMGSIGGELLIAQEIQGQFVNLHGDNKLRLVPEDWVRAAFKRWEGVEKPERKPDALGADIGRGGRDPTVLSPYWEDINYVGEMDIHKGESARDGIQVAGLIMDQIGPDTRVNIDIIGVGTSPFDQTKREHDRTYPVNGALRGVKGTDKTENYEFYNLRAKLLWGIREALDPAYGATLALPPSEKLLIDLISTSWEVKDKKVKIESKEDIKKRIGRSPDEGDALGYTFYEPPPPEVEFFIGGA